MTLLDDCEKYFSTRSLWDVLNCEKTEEERVINRAYHKRALKVHPDKVKEKDRELAEPKFKVS